MEKIALLNARVINGKNFDPTSSCVVLLSGSIIEDVMLNKKISIGEDYKKIDVGNNTLLPLFIDGHMHISGEPGRLDHLGHIKTNLEAVGKLQKCLLWGTGTVAHAAGSIESVILRDLINSGSINGCSDILVGGAITPTCGHVRGKSADGPWEIRKAVREMISVDVDFIKTTASGGFQWKHEKLTHPDYTYEELQVLVEQVHSREKKVHVHAHADPGILNAISAGCDVILHGVLINDICLEKIAEKGLWYMPTLYITSEKVFENSKLPDYMIERMRQTNPFHRQAVRKAFKIGVKIITGTDGGPGSIMYEICELVKCGFSSMEAIIAATSKTADAFGILDKTGTIEKGKKADLMMIKGDPLADVSILCKKESILMIIKNGRIILNQLE
ncbi:MAG TPA: amidohydrolase family protein [Candidatus Ratteibacteria bacterium]|uniref:Imidazolonepropionase n=1 Tax=candidate division TA06 bacterium ADurb.Bin131 TaxID=1852827 RepID=A0A1V6C6Y2_UNCT6|nr:MAG: imidazolonepropionase [candidate division TA06 bacterium ADurb.Bin131]HON06290.1 amidohydrolase family protein [bacterium]HPC29288.1 amidohydrolase family protein [bacterium]HRS06952.1 amidohydrolase family protein [Candidatus Ratteibacteria bacterium]HRV05056.1 amidohydrolase family protein [Candidatus Ratteibacteria bacterium]